MKVLLADDHTLFRDALVQFIARADPEAVVLLAQDMHCVMDIMDGEKDVDLVLLDMRMPGMDGLNGLGRFRARYPGTPVALLSGLAEKSHVEQALKMGAAGFLPKTLSGKAMLGGIQKILGGERFVATDNNTGEIMPSYYDGGGGLQDSAQDHFEGQSEQAGLTPREKDVLTWLLRGASNKDIARALGLQVVTVKLHVRGICRKLGAENRTQAALKAQKMGFGFAGKAGNA